MNKQLLFISVFFAAGVFIGILMTDGEKPSDHSPNTTEKRRITVGSAESGLANPLIAVENDDHTLALENKIAELEARIVELERIVETEAETLPEDKSTSPTPVVTRHNRALTAGLLVESGLSESVADEIVRRRNQIELAKLELNDRSKREGFRNTNRYRDAMKELNESLPPLREELGDETYDRYLYATGQNNRVVVLSVMQGSAAEQVGIAEGDQILSYAQKRIFTWGELHKATGEGQLGEYVSVDVVRDGETLNFWAPRGPLGVRLGTARVKP